MIKHAAATVAVLALAVPATASAAPTVSSDGATITVTGTEGADDLTIEVFDGEVSIIDATGGGPGCELSVSGDVVRCELGSGGLDVRLAGGDDTLRVPSYDALGRDALRVDLGGGHDRYTTQEQAGGGTVAGGAGDDTLEGGSAPEVLDGGDGNDVIDGLAGDDVLHGGAGDDELSGDVMGSRRYADVIDGGAGTDTVDDWMPDDDPALSPPATVTLDGKADDGFSGEGDDVIGVERVEAAAALRYVGDGAASLVVVTEVAAASVLRGLGGADDLRGGDDDDRLDGGGGEDRLMGGYGNDRIVGGPGRDTVLGDRDGRCNEMHCDLSPGSAADTIEVRDEARDVVACGPGVDRVIADRKDRVADDCEKVKVKR